MNIGLYFGTFNPIHVGHLIIANHMADYTELDKVWLVVSPQNPLKEKNSMLPDYHRLALVKTAIEDNPNLLASDIEFELPKPSYTVATLAYLEEKFPQHEFSLIMGEDNLRTFHKWKNHEHIISRHKLYVYPRVLTESEIDELKEFHIDSPFLNHPNVIMCDAPVMKVSSSFIRKAIRDKKDVRYLLTDPVHRYIKEMHFYEK
ncbi:MAG: nicotinate-nucleotide adenylyltransferase [Flavobacteriales bacterium]|nr:nicotinate-nucleotide adenylyltransferase [Flavobacteriales bacterium]